MTSTPRRSPTLRRRRLSAEIRRLRRDAAMTSTKAADQLGWSQGKLSKMELGEWVRPNTRDIDDLCRLYGAADAIRDELVQLAKDSKEKDAWWYPYRHQISEEYSAYIGFEAGASELFVFEPMVVHGLLQTDDYARHILSEGPGELSAEQVEKRVEIRGLRQDLLTREGDPLRLWLVMHESALQTLVGDREFAQAQLRQLLHMAELPKVTIQVIPFSTGVHPGIMGGFTILAFPEEEGPDVAYLENPAGQHFIEADEEVSRFKIAFQRLVAKALDREASRNLIASTIRTDDEDCTDD